MLTIDGYDLVYCGAIYQIAIIVNDSLLEPFQWVVYQIAKWIKKIDARSPIGDSILRSG